MKKILGLDLGTNSIGWALINQDFDNKQGEIIDIGTRIIPMSQDVLGKFDSGVSISQTAERTGFRGVRRLRERHLLRRERLHRVLHILKFLPEHYKNQIDFESRLGQFKRDTEPKLVYNENNQFIFRKSFEEMVAEFKKAQPELFYIKDDGKETLIPYDWTIYYLRKKALTEKIEKEELAWLLLNFNQKRGYYQLRGEDDDDDKKETEFEIINQKVVNVTKGEKDKKYNKYEYKVELENGLIYRASFYSSIEHWIGTYREFTYQETTLKDGTNKVSLSFLPSFDEIDKMDAARKGKFYKKIKIKTENEIDKSKKTVGQYIYDTLLENPTQKINGKLVRVIERKFYKAELEKILITQQQFHHELKDNSLYNLCIQELYKHNEAHRNNIAKRNFLYLFLDDIIFHQRPLRSKKSLISDCKFESRKYLKDGIEQQEALKCIAKSHPLYQEFRLWQWIKNLHIFDRENDSFPITEQLLESEDDYVNLFDFLNNKKDIEQKSLLKYFKLNEKTHRWNFVEDKVYPCNETRSLILNKLSKCEDIPIEFLTNETEEALWHILYSVNDKIEIEKALHKFASKHGLKTDFVEQFKKFPPYKNEYGSYSSKAIKKLLPLMRMGKYWNEASIHLETRNRIEKIINAEFDENIRNRVREKSINLSSIHHFKGLPLWLVSYIVYDRHAEDSNIEKWKTPTDINNFLKAFKQHSLRNPIVEQVITETLRVVKDIWSHYGNSSENFFDEIHIELGREMKNPADKRKKMTETISANENTNLRIKALLAEMQYYNEVENVRPYSPYQQEILKIYEDGVLNSGIEIEDEILKISKTAQPSKTDLLRYKLWLEQKYRSPYTGEMIPLNKLFTPAYEIEHIIPQKRYFDDSFSNKVICESEINKDKDYNLAFEYISNNSGKKVELSGGKFVNLFTIEQYEDFVKTNYAKNYSKAKKLMLLEIPEKMIERQMNDTRYISKEVKNLLSKIVRQDKNDEGTTANNLLSTNGQITNELKKDWGLNDIWNELIASRFERLNTITNSKDFGDINPNTNKFLPTVPLEHAKGFNKKRIDHRHHALDALVIACATRSHINYLNNQNALDKDKAKGQQSREDLKRVLCDKKYNDASEKNYRWIFKQPWSTFAIETKEKLNTTIISFKQNLRVINKTVNKYERWENVNGKIEKVIVEQTKGDSWAIRKSLHKDTVSGKVNLQRIKVPKDKILTATRKNIDTSFNEKMIRSITDEGIQKILINYLKEKDNNPEVAFTAEGIEEMNKSISKYNNGKQGGFKSIEEIKKYINKVADYKLQKELLNHLEINQNDIDKAFSPEGIDNFNSFSTNQFLKLESLN
jgi:CRISPR-associated endonuclease Csn1